MSVMSPIISDECQIVAPKSSSNKLELRHQIGALIFESLIGDDGLLFWRTILHHFTPLNSLIITDESISFQPFAFLPPYTYLSPRKTRYTRYKC
jgi:hypothetical protein